MSEPQAASCSDNQLSNSHSIDCDTSFDFRSDTPPGKDPDQWSPTLRRYHRLLWSKPLPNGTLFQLEAKTVRFYLEHRSSAGDFVLASDSVIPTFIRSKRIAHVIAQIPPSVLDQFDYLGYTIGGMMIFPGNQVDRKMTINAARGCHHLIKDRFDLTVECIRRFYRNEDNPLSQILARYDRFFRLFVDFRGYVEFFLLQDLVDADFESVRFFLPFTEFRPWPLPANVDEYDRYRINAESFLHARNRRILDDVRLRLVQLT